MRRGNSAYTMRADPMHEVHLGFPHGRADIPGNNGKQKVSSGTAVHSPVFRCRKTLTFNDSDLLSDEETSTDTANLNALGPEIPVSIKKPALFDVPVQPYTNGHTEISKSDQLVAPTGIHRTVRKSVTAPDTQPSSIGTTRNRTSTGEILIRDRKLTKSSVKKHVPIKDPVQAESPVKRTRREGPILFERVPVSQSTEALSALKSKFAFEYVSSEPDHAYFPQKTSPPPQPPHITTVFHSDQQSCQNISNSSEHGDQRSFKESPFPGHSRNITVCVRKRPLLPNETRRKEMDMIKIAAPATVTVNLVKVSLNLEKYIHQVQA